MNDPGVDATWSADGPELCGGASAPAARTRAAKLREIRMDRTYYREGAKAKQRDALQF
jgi:hypothetical protein